MNLPDSIKNNLVVFFLGTLVTGFLAGFAAYETILRVADLVKVPKATLQHLQEAAQKLDQAQEQLKLKDKLVDELEKKLGESNGPATGETIIYEDKVPDTNIHNMRFLELTARSAHNPPKVNDRVWVEFTLQNDSNEPIKLLGTYVTAYDPFEKQRDFGFSHKNKIIMPQERIKTAGSFIVDVPGTWELGPHYALGTKWDGEQYPGHWKRFNLPVVQ